MSERTNGQQIATIGRKGGINVPPQSANIGQVGRLLGRGHLLDDPGRQYGCTTVEHRLGELRQVVSGRKYSGVTGHSTHRSRRGIVHHAAQHSSGALVVLGGSNARRPGLRRIEGRHRHAERAEDIVLRVLIERHATHALHQFAKHDEVDVAVHKNSAGRVHQLFGVGPRVGFVQSAPIRLQVEVGTQPRVVGHQLADGDIVLAVLRKLWNVLRYRVIQLHLPELHHAHHGCGGGQHFGKRSHVEDGVGCHRLLRGFERTIAKSFAINHGSIVANQQNGSGRISLLHRISQQRVERREAGLIGAYGRWSWGCGSRRTLRHRPCADKQQERKRDQGENSPAETKTQWMRTLSNSTKMPSFGEQAIISCARIPHICEDRSEPGVATSRHTPACFRRSGKAVCAGVCRHSRRNRATCLPRRALAVTHRGSLVASQGFGNFTYDEGAPQVQAETVFDLASVTKVVATTAVAMLLYERCRLTLDAPLESFLPEFVSLAPRHQQAARRSGHHSHAAGPLQWAAGLREAVSVRAVSR